MALGRVEQALAEASLQRRFELGQLCCAEPLIAATADELRALGARVELGIFGAHMEVALVNNGPVTLIVEI